MVRLTSFLAAAALVHCGSVTAHPGKSHSHEHVKREIRARDNLAAIGRRSLASCSNSASAQQLKARAVKRRADKVQELRQKRGIKSPSKKYRRDEDDVVAWEGVNHNMTGSVSYNMFTPLETVFDANTSCILAPEVTGGPYYVVGEYLRSNVIEDQYCDGVPLFLEVQYVDITTCEPVPAVAVDVWNCNATGVYSGIDVNGNVAADGVNSTYLRGIQLTDHDGVVQFETIFPGHYEGRATHTHLLSHMNVTALPNGTISVWDAPVAHIGQLFYPESLRSAVETLEPYSSNTVEVLSNDDDMWAAVQADSAYDPFPEFVYLGEDLQDGLMAWIQIGINTSADYSTDSYYGVAGYLGEDGGHALDSGIGGGGGTGGSPDGGNGTFNGTAPPSNSTSA